MTKKIELNIIPMGAVRMSQRDQWPGTRTKRAQTYFDYKDVLFVEARDKGFVLEEVLPFMVFVLPMPKSWSKKKKALMYGQKHQSRPDLDNMIKGFKDALAKEDSFVWKYAGAEKRWGDTGKIVIHQE